MPRDQNFEMMLQGQFLSETYHIIYQWNRENLNFSDLKLVFEQVSLGSWYRQFSRFWGFLNKKGGFQFLCAEISWGHNF